MEKNVLTYVDLDGTPHLVGRLWARARPRTGNWIFCCQELGTWVVMSVNLPLFSNYGGTSVR